MPLTKAVASSAKTPGFYLLLNLLGQTPNPGTDPLNAILLAPKSSAGNITANTEVRQCFGPDDVATALGAGTPGHLAAKKFFKRFPLGRLDVAAPTASGGAAATATQTFTGPATENSTVRFRIHGRQIDVDWFSAEAATTFVARAVSKINEHASDLFVTASDATGGSLLLTAKVAGPWGNDVRLWVGVIAGGGGIAVTANPAAATGGTTEPIFATVLSLISTKEYARIIPCLSNADAADTTSSSNAERVANHVTQFGSGNAALLQVATIGVSGSTTNAKAGSVDRNNPAVQYVLGRTWDDLPCEFAGGDAGDALNAISQSGRPNFNRIGNTFDYYGPRDVVANKLSAAEIEDLLNNGVSPLDINPNGVPYLVAPITTRSTTGSAPDYRAFHLSDTDAMFAIFRDLRNVTPIEFANASISEDLPAGADPLPPGVVERRDVEAFILSRLRFWARRGVVAMTKLDAAIAAGELIVAIDDVDGAQVNIFVPVSIIKPLSKFGVVGSKAA